jgi:hypothetical protein
MTTSSCLDRGIAFWNGPDNLELCSWELHVMAGAWVRIATAALGAIVAVAEGWQRITSYSHAWTGYRTASEWVKREWRLYVDGARGYHGLPENEAFLLFVEAVEAILPGEQQIFWRARESGDEVAPQPGSAAHTKEPKHA